jgi:hypothetical protein
LADKKKKEEKDPEEVLSKSERRALRQKKRALRREKWKKRRNSRSNWHPLNLLYWFGMFLLTLVKIAFFPYVFAYWKIRDTVKFLLTYNSPEHLDRPLISEEDGDVIPKGYLDEKKFIRSLPNFYFLAGALGGLIAIFITFDFMEPVWSGIKYFFDNFSWAYAWDIFLTVIKAIFVDGIWTAIYWTGWGIWWLISTVFGWMFSQNFWVPLLILIALGSLIVVIFVVLNEAPWTEKVMAKIRGFFVNVFTFPKRLWGWIKTAYINFQKMIAQFTYGKNSLDLYKKLYFYRIVIYSSIVTLWIIVSTFIVIIYTETFSVFNTPGLVYPLGLFTIGLLNGVFFLALISFIVRKLSKGRYYIDPENYQPDEKKKAPSKS